MIPVAVCQAWPGADFPAGFAGWSVGAHRAEAQAFADCPVAAEGVGWRIVSAPAAVLEAVAWAASPLIREQIARVLARAAT